MDQARTLLGRLHANLYPDERVEVRCFKEGQEPRRLFFSDIEQAVSFGVYHGDEYDVYHGVCPRVGESGRAEAVRRMPYLWLDLDFKGQHTADTRLRQLEGLEIAPSLLVGSGGGFHAYWRLTEPLEGPGDIARGRQWMRMMADALGCDHTDDPPRILRMPDTLNHKYDPPVPCTLLEDRDTVIDVRVVRSLEVPDREEDRYVFTGEVDQALTVKHPRDKIIEAGLPEGGTTIEGEVFEGRNTSMFEWACRKRDEGLKIDYAVALARIVDRQNRPPLGDSAVIDIVRRAYNYGLSLVAPTEFTVVDEPVNTSSHRIGWADLHTAQVPEPQWIVHGLLPVGLILLIGKSKIGKSWLALQLAAMVATGQGTMGPHTASQGPVWFFGLEDTLGRLKGRLKRYAEAGLNPTNDLTLITKLERLTPDNLFAFRDELVAAREAGSLPALIVIDILNRVKPARGKNSDIYDEDAAFMANLQALAQHFGIAMLVIHHARKITSSDPMDDVLGTTAIAGGADMILALSRERGSDAGKLSCMGRETGEARYELHWDRNTCVWAYVREVDDWGQVGRPPRESGSAEAWLADLLSGIKAEDSGLKDDKTLRVKDIEEIYENEGGQEVLGFSWRTVRRIATNSGAFVGQGPKTDRMWTLVSIVVEDPEGDDDE